MIRQASLCVAALCLGACTTPKVSAPKELPLTRVAVYRNGVGYFERAGKVDDERLQFKVKPEHVGDFLASLAIMEKGGSSVRAASFPLKTEPAPEPPPAPDGTPPPARKPRMDTVILELDGKEHELAVGYVTEQPVWKPSYRLVLGKAGPRLQVWGIVQNLSGEDWNDVRLSLVAGAPIAFQSTLQLPVTPPRPVVNDSGELISAVPRGESTLAYAPPPPPMAAPAPRAPSPGGARSAARPKKAPAAPAAEAAPGMPDDSSMAGAAPEYEFEDSLPQNLSMLAAQTVEAGATRYDLAHKVTIPNDSATMVLLLSEPVKGEAVFMFAPEGGVPDSARHPFRVARFTNTTPGLLERGPIAVYEASSFLGQGVMESLSAGGEATVPFALERGLALDRDQKSTTEAARLAKIEHGQLHIERDQVVKTTYLVRNGLAEEARVVVRHPRVQGMRLHQPPAGTEDQVGKQVALVPVQVGARNKGEVTVDERRAFPTWVDWFSAEADQAIRAYIADKRARPEAVDRLKRAWALRDAMVKNGQERQKLASEQNILQNAAEQTRANLRSIQRNTSGVEELRKQLAARLAELDDRLARVNKRLVELELSLNEDRVRFEELLRDLTITDPLPPEPKS